MTRTAFVSAAALALLPAALAAQTAAPVEEAAPGFFEVEDDATLVNPFSLTVDQLDDYPVIGASGEEIGEVEDVLANAAGEPVALVIETEGFLGIGDEDVIVMLEDIEVVDDRLRVDMTEDELEALPKWDD